MSHQMKFLAGIRISEKIKVITFLPFLALLFLVDPISKVHKEREKKKKKYFVFDHFILLNEKQ